MQKSAEKHIADLGNGSKLNDLCLAAHHLLHAAVLDGDCALQYGVVPLQRLQLRAVRCSLRLQACTQALISPTCAEQMQLT